MGSILKPPANFQKKNKSALHWHTFLFKASWSELDVFPRTLVRIIWPMSQHYLLLFKARTGYYIKCLHKASWRALFFPHLKFPVRGRSLEKKTSVWSEILVRGKRITYSHFTKPAFIRANFLLQRNIHSSGKGNTLIRSVLFAKEIKNGECL